MSEKIADDEITRLEEQVNRLYEQERYEEAIIKAKELCMLQKQASGINVNYAGSLNNLAELYKEVGNYKAAEQLFVEALDIWRDALGEQHPNCAGLLHNLATNTTGRLSLLSCDSVWVLPSLSNNMRINNN